MRSACTLPGDPLTPAKIKRSVSTAPSPGDRGPARADTGSRLALVARPGASRLPWQPPTRPADAHTERRLTTEEELARVHGELAVRDPALSGEHLRAADEARAAARLARETGHRFRSNNPPGAALGATRTNDPLVLRTYWNGEPCRGRGHGLF